MSFKLEDLNYDKDNLERRPWERYMEQFRLADPVRMSANTGYPYNEETQIFTVTFMGKEYLVHFPDFEVKPVEEKEDFYPLVEILKAKILVLRFMLEAVTVKSTGKFLTYRETPWGEVYLRQFDGRCIKRLAFSYGNKISVFERVMEHLGASPAKNGDISYDVELFPGFTVRMILWEGDEEFPPSSQILFSDNFPMCFQAEDMAVTGDVIIGTLKAVEKMTAAR